MRIRIARAATTALFALLLARPVDSRADTSVEIDRDVLNSLDKLYATVPAAKALGEKAKAVLVFPHVLKGGVLVGGSYGEGALVRDGKPTDYYGTASITVGVQIGAQTYGYALMLMTEDALDYLYATSGWQLGTGPTIVFIDSGAAATLSNQTARSDVYAFVFDPKGLMFGLNLEGSKITRIVPDDK
ncbi:twin-arginine translocation pathway signal protein [bacterium]|nr:twin-arginine translocation pathway signal protein [bacterium]